MTYKKGYYISHVLCGLIHGPRAKDLDKESIRREAVRAEIVHGVPFVNSSKVSTFDQIDADFSLLRYAKTDREIYVFNFVPGERQKYQVVDESNGFSIVQSIPALARVFDELAPIWVVEKEVFEKRRLSSEREAMEAAGITSADFPQPPERDMLDPCFDEYELKVQLFMDKIDAHYPVLEPIAIAVEGIDDILKSAPIWKSRQKDLDMREK